jgi:hypothetical protein
MVDFVDAEAGVRQLQARYIDSVWRKDYDAFGDCFTEDTEWRIAGTVLHGRQACVDILKGFMDNFDRVLMSMQTPLLQVTGDQVIGRTYVTEMNIFKDRRPGFTIGIYYDRFAEQNGRWRFAWHHFQMYYIGKQDMSGKWFQISDYGPPFGMPKPDENATPLASDIFGK